MKTQLTIIPVNTQISFFLAAVASAVCHTCDPDNYVVKCDAWQPQQSSLVVHFRVENAVTHQTVHCANPFVVYSVVVVHEMQ